MNAREFFYLVAEMRRAQRNYFKTREQRTLVASKILEKQVDEEIIRVEEIERRRIQEEQFRADQATRNLLMSSHN